MAFYHTHITMWQYIAIHSDTMCNTGICYKEYLLCIYNEFCVGGSKQKTVLYALYSTAKHPTVLY